MAIKNQSYICYYKAWDNANLEWKTGDVANHTIRTVLDGTETAADNAPVEVSAANCPGLYKITLTADEFNGNSIAVDGKSSTADISLHFYPVMTERGNLGTVDTVVDGIKSVTDVLPDAGVLSSLAQDNTVAKEGADSDTLETLSDQLDGVQTQVDKMNFTGDDIKATLDGEGVQVSGMDADTLNAAAVKADAVTKIQAGLALTAALTVVDTVVDAIKAKTDLLPDNPAETGDEMTLSASERTAVAQAILDITGWTQGGTSKLSRLFAALGAELFQEAETTKSGDNYSTVYNDMDDETAEDHTSVVTADGDRTSVTLEGI